MGGWGGRGGDLAAPHPSGPDLCLLALHPARLEAPAAVQERHHSSELPGPPTVAAEQVDHEEEGPEEEGIDIRPAGTGGRQTGWRGQDEGLAADDCASQSAGQPSGGPSWCASTPPFKTKEPFLRPATCRHSDQLICPARATNPLLLFAVPSL